MCPHRGEGWRGIKPFQQSLSLSFSLLSRGLVMLNKCPWRLWNFCHPGRILAKYLENTHGYSLPKNIWLKGLLVDAITAKQEHTPNLSYYWALWQTGKFREENLISKETHNLLIFQNRGPHKTPSWYLQSVLCIRSMTKSQFLKNQYSDTSENSPSLLNSDVLLCYLEHYQFQNNCDWYDSRLSEMISEGIGSEVNVWEEMIEQGLRPPSVVGVYLWLGEGDLGPPPQVPLLTLFNTNTKFHHLIPWIFS